MKRFFLISLLFLVGVGGNAQIIPTGTSSEVVNIYGDGGFNARTVWYYKATTYDSATSPILWVMHGLGGDGAGAIGWVQNIAEQRNALIVAPNAWYMSWANGKEGGLDTTCAIGSYFMFLPAAFKQIYRNVLQRENRNTVPVYLTGFSAGGQTVTRYMLVRQLEPDSIPIRMAVSVNPAYYTVCLDSINGNEHQWPCGISPSVAAYNISCHYPPLPNPPWNIDTVFISFCNDHIVQYYNENYGVLIGTADTVYGVACSEPDFGTSRYGRAQFFYNFSDTNAITRGTTLQWIYDTVSGVGHAGWAMYNTKENVLDTFTIAERMLFGTLYHNVPQVAPVADFEADTTVVYLPNATVQFTNKSTTATSYVWNFGDTTFSTAVNPVHQYTYADTFTVWLTAINGNGCESKARKWDYIIVNDGVGIDEHSQSEFSIYPNPTSGKARITNYDLRGTRNEGRTGKIEVLDVFGRVVKEFVPRSSEIVLDLSHLPQGIYFVRVGTAVRKLVLAR